MCGHYFAGDEIPEDELIEILNRVRKNTQNEGQTELDLRMKMRGQISMSNIAPVITRAGLDVMRFGFTRFNGGLSWNARSEDIFTTQMYQKPVRETRCLIPAAWYYEWEPIGKQKLKRKIWLRDSNVMRMAAVYRKERDVNVPVFSILTRAPATNITHIHDRMPVILGAAAQEEWLSPDGSVENVLSQAITDVVFAPDENQPEQLSLF